MKGPLGKTRTESHYLFGLVKLGVLMDEAGFWMNREWNSLSKDGANFTSGGPNWNFITVFLDKLKRKKGILYLHLQIHLRRILA